MTLEPLPNLVVYADYRSHSHNLPVTVLHITCVPKPPCQEEALRRRSAKEGWGIPTGNWKGYE